MTDALIIGAGPAGLMAAEQLADAGHSVLVVDAKPSFGRKFLMAGKSGLNLTKDQPLADFLAAFGKENDWIFPSVSQFPPSAVSKWAQQLGQQVFTGSSGRVFPKSMKASPLLRTWLARLSDKGVRFQTRTNWLGWNNGALFDTPDGAQTLNPKVTILALGGASWSRLGSTGAWARILQNHTIDPVPFQPMNMGFCVDWSDHMTRHFGSPVKALRLKAGDQSILGELVISKQGIEGGAVYALSKSIRNGAVLSLDLAPDVTAKTLSERLEKQSDKASRATILRKAFGLSPVKIALVNECARGARGADLVGAVKSLTLPLSGTRPMDEAISTSGGVPAHELTDDFMLRKKPGVFCAGEMLDWDAPTGGYLITACLATGRTAGLGACAYLASGAQH